MHIKANFQRESIKLCNFRNKTSTCSKTFREKTLTHAEISVKRHQQVSSEISDETRESSEGILEKEIKI